MNNHSNQTTTGRNFRHATLLVVEDNADHWDLIRLALEKVLPEVKPIWVTNSGQALNYLTDCLPQGIELPKLILLDLYLPNREEGWQLLKQVKVHTSFKQIPIVVLSSSNDRADITNSYLYGSTSYFTKPIDGKSWSEYIQTLRLYWWETVTLPTDQYMM